MKSKNINIVLTIILAGMLTLSGCGGGGSSNIANNNPDSSSNTNGGSHSDTESIESLSIRGTPEAVAYYFTNNTNISGISYNFQPTVNRVLDKITFTIDKKPKWASFNPKTGVLYGTPATGDDGIYPVTISVSDGHDTAVLHPFEIEVQPWDNKSFCAAKAKKDNKIHCSVINSSIATPSQCDPWLDMYSPRLDKSSIKLYTDKKGGDIKSLQKNTCETYQPSYDPTTNSCPSGSTVVIPFVGPPMCIVDMPIEQRAEEIAQGIKEEYDDYLKERDEYKKRPDALSGFEPLSPSITGPDNNGKVVITIPPSIDLQHKLEEQKRRLDKYTNDLKNGNVFQSPNVIIECPEIDSANGWNKGVCFEWGDEFGDKGFFSIEVEAMGMLRVSGEASSQFTVSGNIAGKSVSIFDVREQSRVWDAPSEINSFYALSTNARDSLKNVIQDVDDISNDVKNLHDRVQGSGIKAEINTLNQSLKKYATNEASNNDLIFKGEKFLKEVNIPSTPIVVGYPVLPGIDGVVTVSTKGTFEMQPTASLNHLLQFDKENPAINALTYASIEPSLDTELTLTAKADIAKVAEIGVGGSLKLLKLETPFYANASLNDLLNNLPPKLQLGWKAKILSGKVYVFGKIKENVIVKEILNVFSSIFKKEVKIVEKRKEIYNFPGYELSGPDGDYLPIYCSRGEDGCSFKADENRYEGTEDGIVDNKMGLEWLTNDIKLADIRNDNYCQTLNARRPYLYELLEFIRDNKNLNLMCGNGEFPCSRLPSRDGDISFVFFDDGKIEVDGLSGEFPYDTLCVRRK